MRQDITLVRVSHLKREEQTEKRSILANLENVKTNIRLQEVMDHQGQTTILKTKIIVRMRSHIVMHSIRELLKMRRSKMQRLGHHLSKWRKLSSLKRRDKTNLNLMLNKSAKTPPFLKCMDQWSRCLTSRNSSSLSLKFRVKTLN